MGRKSALAISVLLALAGVAGVYATIQTLEVGKQAESEAVVADDTISLRKKKLDDWAKRLKAASARRPPSLPPIPQFSPVAMPSSVPPRVSARTRASAPEPSAPARSGPKGSGPKPKNPTSPVEDVVYIPSEPIIKTVQPVVEKTCSDAEVKAIKAQVKARIAPLEAEKNELKAQIDQIESQAKTEEAALRAQLEPLKAQADLLEGDAKKQFKATTIEPLEAQLRQVKEQKDALLAPLRARADALKYEIEQTWTDAFANPACAGT
jgi:hypothetical protein